MSQKCLFRNSHKRLRGSQRYMVIILVVVKDKIIDVHNSRNDMLASFDCEIKSNQNETGLTHGLLMIYLL